MFRDEEGCPVLDWFRTLPTREANKGLSRLERLALLGHGLRRPEAEYLEEGIYESRWRFQSVNYRLLYFFHGRDAVVLSHGFTKEDRIPPREIDRALRHKVKYMRNPLAHSQEVDLP